MFAICSFVFIVVRDVKKVKKSEVLWAAAPWNPACETFEKPEVTCLPEIRSESGSAEGGSPLPGVWGCPQYLPSPSEVTKEASDEWMSCLRLGLRGEMW